MNYGQRTEGLICEAAKAPRSVINLRSSLSKRRLKVMDDNPNGSDSFVIDVKGH